MPSSIKVPESPQKSLSGHDDAVDADSHRSSSPLANGNAKVWAKLDLNVLPVVAIMFFLSSLDRSNIGNALIAGLPQDLKMTPVQYSIALTVTLIPYTFVNFGTNILMKIIGPRFLLPTMVTLWGLTATLQGIVHNYNGLLACRFFLGLFEGGILPGITLYLASFYPKRGLQFRGSIMYSAVSFAYAFSGLLAAAIIRMDGVGGRPGWAWLFILEGCFTVFYGLASFFLLPNTPTSSPLLKDHEKKQIVAALHQDGIVLIDEHDPSYTWAEARRIFTCPHVLLIALAAFLNGVTVGGLGYFLPSIVQSLGFSGSHAQLMSVPPFAVAAVLSILTSIFSDRYAQRGLTMIFFGLMAAAGFGLFLGAKTRHVRYGSLFLLVPGGFAGAPPLGTWIANNTAPLVRRALAIALVLCTSGLGSIFATWLLGTISPAPGYTVAAKVLLAFQVGVVLCAAVNMVWLRGQNAKKARLRAEATVPEGGEQADLLKGDDSIWYEYVM